MQRVIFIFSLVLFICSSNLQSVEIPKSDAWCSIEKEINAETVQIPPKIQVRKHLKKGKKHIVTEDTLAFPVESYARRYIGAVYRANTIAFQHLSKYRYYDISDNIYHINATKHSKTRESETVENVLKDVGKSAIPLKAGTEVIFVRENGNCGKVKIKKDFLYLNSYLLTPKRK